MIYLVKVTCTEIYLISETRCINKTENLCRKLLHARETVTHVPHRARRARTCACGADVKIILDVYTPGIASD